MGYNGYGIYSKNKSDITNLINKIIKGYNDTLFTYYGIIYFKDRFETENIRFEQGDLIVYGGGERLRTVYTVFNSTQINMCHKNFNIRNYFDWENDSYLYKFKTTYRYEETDKIIFIPFEKMSVLNGYGIILAIIK